VANMDNACIDTRLAASKNLHVAPRCCSFDQTTPANMTATLESVCATRTITRAPKTERGRNDLLCAH
jgi:hypothetical protein